jgi:hypothetical protein
LLNGGPYSFRSKQLTNLASSPDLPLRSDRSKKVADLSSVVGAHQSAKDGVRLIGRCLVGKPKQFKLIWARVTGGLPGVP